jgi:hypothetical protein
VEPEEPVEVDPRDLLEPVATQLARALHLQDRIVLYGEVRTPSEDLVAGAEIWLAGGKVAVSDGAGRYRLESEHQELPAEDEQLRFATLVARKAGVGQASREAPCYSGRVDFVLEPGGEVFGRVYDRASLRPVANTVVHFQSFQPGEKVPQLELCHGSVGTDPDGLFLIDQLPRRPLKLRARAPGFSMTQWKQLSLADGPLEPLQLKMTAVQVLHGQFQPWPPTDVEDLGSIQVGTNLGSDLADGGEVDSDGRFQVRLHGRFAKFELLLSSSQQILYRDQVEVPTGMSEFDAGILRLPTIQVQEGQLANDSFFAFLEPEVCLLRGGPAELSAPRAPVGEGGHFTIRTISSSSAPLALVLLDSPPIALAAGFEVKEPLIVGKVTDAEGRPLGGRYVRLERLQRDRHWGMRATCRTDAEGRYVLQTGLSYWKQMRAPVRMVLSTKARRTPLIHTLKQTDDSLLRVDLTLPEPAPSNGKLSDPKGHPLPNWRVRYESLDRQIQLADITAADGTFQLLDANQSHYNVQLTSPEGVTYELPHQSMEDLDLVRPR